MQRDPWYLLGWLLQALVGVVDSHDHEDAVDLARRTLREVKAATPLTGPLADDVNRACRRTVTAETARRMTA